MVVICQSDECIQIVLNSHIFLELKLIRSLSFQFDSIVWWSVIYGSLNEASIVKERRHVDVITIDVVEGVSSLWSSSWCRCFDFLFATELLFIPRKFFGRSFSHWCVRIHTWSPLLVLERFLLFGWCWS